MGLARPATSPKTPGEEVISQSQAVHWGLSGRSSVVVVRLVLSQWGGGGMLFSCRKRTGSTSKLTTRIDIG